MPLAVTIRSLLNHLAPDRRLQLFLLDGGIRVRTLERLRASWEMTRVDLTVLRPDVSRLRNLRVSNHVNHLTYYRMLLPELLPESLDKVLYLDSDLLVRHDIGELWDEPLDHFWALAVQDYAAPFINVAIGVDHYSDIEPYIAATKPVGNYEELGLDPRAPYLNGGVLLIALQQWRQQGLTQRMLDCLHQHAAHVLWWDQYALNVALAGHWNTVDHRWNQGAQIYQYPDGRHSPFEEHVFQSLLHDPFIVHFTSPDKPWRALCKHPYRQEFYQVLDQTDWRRWRPSLGAAASERCRRAYQDSLDYVYLRTFGRDARR